jgi:rhodanese-related sulfurtransferase
VEIHAIRTPGLGTVEGSKLVYVPDLLGGVAADFDPGLPVWVLCETGFRASMAASLLAPHGFHPVVLDGSGVREVRESMSNDQ